MLRVVERRLPDGTTRRVQPFHMSMEGLETAILCRDEDDYDALVKIMCVAARRKNVIVVIYVVVSNHCHAGILATSQVSADEYGQEVKRIYSMWFTKRYGENNVLRHVDIKAIALDSDSYVRNALAYIPRNALDNGCNVNEYAWSGYRAMFSGQSHGNGLSVRMLTKREREKIMHTGDDLRDTEWILDNKRRLVPESWCDTAYLEQAFENDPAFFLKAIGSQNSAEMHQVLVENPRERLPDSEFFKYVNNLSDKWFHKNIGELTLDRKLRIASYLFRTMRTSVNQLSRALSLERDKISAAVKRKVRES